MGDRDFQPREFIETSLAQGKSKEDIYMELLSRGCRIDDIQKEFDAIVKEKNKSLPDVGKLIHFILIAGAFLVGAGIFSMLAVNWSYLPIFVKVGTIIFFIIVFYGAGWYLRQMTTLSKTGEALLLAGSITYGAGLFLIAQMFHIRANWPEGFLLWMIGVTAMGFAVKSYPLFYLTFGLGMIVVARYPFSLSFIDYERPYDHISLPLLFVTMILVFVSSREFRRQIPPDIREDF